MGIREENAKEMKVGQTELPSETQPSSSVVLAALLWTVQLQRLGRQRPRLLQVHTDGGGERVQDDPPQREYLRSDSVGWFGHGEPLTF